ncbi:type I-E CRISPR-associated protein Cas7/Cse4/CasC [Methylococcus sp. EFPC2]|uniref:type I-E CRISPR-associated protein Cas7/Cse4/CasC n=1 Tax=Methylococcus sp. EFPC2 TaxID=2812648 RepID=UPI0019679096|nr:type I-E CRISPR-associated protein Cas7/Cse4/CasC [Methylococcus sp. EFPC2]QSA96790.1 type I-E CRISPR-associated protein Cas7/Cse4/CasC [Methylococcus sp. EFPC2]
MNSKNFVNFHVLISHSPSCLNRDDSNMQKTAMFGGVTRVRISSQSLKRAMRRPPETGLNYWAEHLGDPSFRTRSLEKAKAELIAALGGEFDRELIEEAATRFVRTVKSLEDAGGDAEEAPAAANDEAADDGKEAEKQLAVAPWVNNEIREICRILKEVKAQGLSDEEKEKAFKKVGKSVGKGKDKRTLTKEDCLAVALSDKIAKRLEESAELIRSAIGGALDIALFGRMATSGLMTSVDGAMAVAHVITTHAVEPQDVDWFTAVDDLTEDSGEMGAGHLNTQQFSAGVFYRYASLNLKQLQVNLGLIGDMKATETAESRARALEIAKHLFHMLATVVPSAMQGRHAAFNPADFAIVSFSDQPISLANAFEAPVQRGRNGGYLSPSMVELAEYWRRLNSAYGLNETAAAFRFGDELWESGVKKPWPHKLAAFDTLSKLESWITRDGQG